MLFVLALVWIPIFAGIALLVWQSPRARRRAVAVWRAAARFWAGRAARRSCRIRRAWRVMPNSPCPSIRAALSAHMAGATSVGLLDVTGFDLIGRGPGASGALAYDAISNWNQVPVSLLLLDPLASAVDPDRSIVTVSQEAIAEMGVSDRSYRRRLRATLDAVEDLNEHRPDEAKIQIRLYTEKPTMTAVILDRSAFVSPWEPVERERAFALFEAAEVGSSFFEIYRRHFVRLWRGSEPLRPEIAAFLREGSQAVPKGSSWESALRAAMRSSADGKVVVREVEAS